VDTPYHRLARTERHRWWRPLVGTLLVLVLGIFATGFVIGFLRVTLPDGPAWRQASGLIALAVWIPVVLLAARWVQRRPAGSVSSVVGRLRWRWQLVCAGLAGLAVLASVVIGVIVQVVVVAVAGESGSQASESLQWVGWLPFLGATVLILVTVPFQAAGEEYFTRGWMVQVFGCYLRTPWVGIIVGGLLWALAHSPSTPWAWAVLLLWSLVLGWLVIRTGGLEAAIAFHVVNNLYVLIVQAAFVGGLSDVPNAGGAGWKGLVVDAFLLSLYAWMVVRLAHRFRMARTSPAPADPVDGEGHLTESLTQDSSRIDTSAKLSGFPS
jgi:membrane protease YdiL (CAAX protease family)